LALPEGARSRDAGCGRDEHAVARDLLDPPARSAEQERLPGTGLVDHLLIELADAATAVDQVDAEEAAVRNRARIRDSEPPCPFASANDAARAVPHDPRPELRKLIRRIAAREHVEDVLELDARKLGKRIGAADELVQLADLDLLVGADRDDLLCQDIEGVARDH